MGVFIALAMLALWALHLALGGLGGSPLGFALIALGMGAVLWALIDTLVLKGVEQALMSEQRRAELAEKDMEGFLYSVSHDLRSPLMAIGGFSEALSEDHAEALGPEGRKYLERIGAGVQRMEGQIGALLALSRLMRTEIKREPLDLTALFRECGQGLALKEPGRKVELTVHDGLSAMADRAMVVQLVDILMGNAWKFTSATQGARVQVTSRALGPGGQALLSGYAAFCVSDNGAGFEMKHADKLFMPFQRLHSDKHFGPGLGMGLATAHKIAARHGGLIWAESEAGRGTALCFTLPAVKS